MAKNRTRYNEALKRGWALIAKEQWKQALGVFRIAVKEFPKEADPYIGLGDACLGLKQVDRALECYKIASRYSRGDLSHLRKVADMQERLGRLSDAGRTYMAIGEILLRDQEIEEAVSNWLRAVGLEPNLLGAHRRLASIFQRQNNIRAAVREYLAIARILQMEGKKKQALQMCKAALKLDPDSQDVIKAIELIRLGPDALEDDDEDEAEEAAEAEADEEQSEEQSLASTVRQMASIFEAEKQNWKLTQKNAKSVAAGQEPIAFAKRLAQEQLAEEIFREEEDLDLLYGSGTTGMSKLERDALIGQAMDFHTRGDTSGAISCYEQAIKGGLNMPAAHFTLGMLYLDERRVSEARRAFDVIAQDEVYGAASNKLLSGA